MNLKPGQIKLNGKLKNVNDLLNNSAYRGNWQKEFYDFLNEWYSENDFILVQTSGSTGNPKTIQLKKDFVAESAKRTIAFFGLKENDKVLHCLPSKYIAGKLMVVRAILGRLDLYLIDPSEDFNLLEKNHFKFAALVPIQVQKLFLQRKLNLDKLLIGGDAIPIQLESKLQKLKTACYSSYGMTETATHIALRKINGKEASSYYHCLGDIRVDLSEDECLQILMPEEEVLQTTDIAELKNDRTFKILGRSDNVIISGGVKYNPEKIERILEKIIKVPFIVSSLPHEKLGKQLILLIECAPDKALQQKIEEYCRDQLTQYERPRQIKFVAKLSKTTTGKIIRT